MKKKIHIILKNKVRIFTQKKEKKLEFTALLNN